LFDDKEDEDDDADDGNTTATATAAAVDRDRTPHKTTVLHMTRNMYGATTIHRCACIACSGSKVLDDGNHEE